MSRRLTPSDLQNALPDVTSTLKLPGLESRSRSAATAGGYRTCGRKTSVTRSLPRAS